MYEKVKALCDKNGISISRLERELGFSKASLNKLKLFEPSFAKVQKIADYFGVSIEYFL